MKLKKMINEKKFKKDMIDFGYSNKDSEEILMVLDSCRKEIESPQLEKNNDLKVAICDLWLEKDRLTEICKNALDVINQIGDGNDAYLGQPSKGGINVSQQLREAIK